MAICHSDSLFANQTTLRPSRKVPETDKEPHCSGLCAPNDFPDFRWGWKMQVLQLHRQQPREIWCVNELQGLLCARRVNTIDWNGVWEAVCSQVSAWTDASCCSGWGQIPSSRAPENFWNHDHAPKSSPEQYCFFGGIARYLGILLCKITISQTGIQFLRMDLMVFFCGSFWILFSEKRQCWMGVIDLLQYQHQAAYFSFRVLKIQIRRNSNHYFQRSVDWIFQWTMRYRFICSIIPSPWIHGWGCCVVDESSARVLPFGIRCWGLSAWLV